jgi:hypothetical protein
MTRRLIQQGTGIDGLLAEIAADHRRAERLRRILDQAAGIDTEPEGKHVSRSTLPGDRRKLRGIPVVGPGVAGHVPGTRPDR